MINYAKELEKNVRDMKMYFSEKNVLYQVLDTKDKKIIKEYLDGCEWISDVGEEFFIENENDDIWKYLIGIKMNLNELEEYIDLTDGTPSLFLQYKIQDNDWRKNG